MQAKQDHPSRRRYDNTIVYNTADSYEKIKKLEYKKHQESFFSLLFNYFKRQHLFFENYGLFSPVELSLWQLITQGNPFQLSSSVYSYIKNEIIPKQQYLRPIITKIYQWGWCDPIGRRILKPLEFNLISNTQRVMDATYCEDFLVGPFHPEKSISKLDFFLAYYFSIAYDSANTITLFEASQNILPIIAAEQPDVFELEEIDTILDNLRSFFSQETEDKFVIPLFETYYGHPIQNIRTYITPIQISDQEYYAEESLKQAMRLKERQYHKRLEQQSQDLSFTLAMLDTIQQDLKKDFSYFSQASTKKNYGGNHKPLIEYIVERGATQLKISPESCNPQQRAYLAIQFFIQHYAPILTEILDMRETFASPKLETSALFRDDLFKEEIKIIRENLIQVTNIAGTTSEKKLFKLPNEQLSNEELSNLNLLNNIADQYFSIAKKLYMYLHDSDKEISGYPLASVDLEKYKSKFHHHILYSLSGTKTNNLFSQHLVTRVIASILEEIRCFCFQYTYEFESDYRSFAPQSERQETLKTIVANQSNYVQKFHELQTELK